MQQLPLQLVLAEHARFDTWVAGPNSAILAAVQAVVTGEAPLIQWLHGAAGSGRSHLLQAVVAAAGQCGQRCAWLPLAAGLEPAQIDGMGQLDIVCLDDVDSVAADRDWQLPLFRLFESLRASRGRLLVTAERAPTDAGFLLPDLASRMASGPVWRMRPLDEESLLQALQLRARHRGFELPEETARYLLRRVDRSAAVMFALLDRLDTAALAAQRRLTVPLARQILNTDDASG